MLIGHEKNWKFFSRAVGEEVLSHSYIFHGPDQVGKKTFALNLASELLKVPVLKLTTSPDYYLLERVEDEKTGKLKQDISIAQTRALKQRLTNGSWLRGYQVVIINEAEKLNEESGNSLLKLLEEPGSKTIFFLITVDEQAILPTIRSRSQLINFGLVSNGVLKSGLIQLGYKDQDVCEVLPLSVGRPGKAIELLEDSGKFLELKNRQEILKRMLSSSLQENLSAVEKIFKDKKEMTREKEVVKDLIDEWQIIFRKLLLEISPSTTWDKRRIIAVLKDLYQTKSLLKTNTQPRLLLEQIIINF